MADPVVRVEWYDEAGNRIILQRFVAEDSSETVQGIVRDHVDATLFDATLTRAEFQAKIDELLPPEE